MKFSVHLTTHITPEWQKQYINYTALKGELYTALGGMSNASAVDAATIHAHFNECDYVFFDMCSVELDKINNFFEEKLTEAKRKFSALKLELERCLNDHDGHHPVLPYKLSSTRQPSICGDHPKWSRPSSAFEFGNRASKSKSILPDGRINDMEKLLRRRNTILQEVMGKSLNNELGYESSPPPLSLHHLKLAYSEYYLSLVLLQNYQTLNGTGFRKILKKHDKLFQRSNGLQWYNEMVSKSLFYLDNTVDDLITAVETIYIQDLEKGDRRKAMRRLRVPPLAYTPDPKCVFRVGLFAGVFLLEAITAVISAIYVEHQSFSWPAFAIFRTTFLIIFYVCLLAMNLYGWRSSGVNHVLIFEIDPRLHMDHFQMLEFGLLMADFWGLFVILYIFSPYIGVAQFAPPFIFVVLMFAYVFSPLPVLHYRSRRWFLKIFLRVLRAPCAHVNFPDFFFGDQLYSAYFIFPDLAFFLCFYGSYLDWPSMSVKQSLRNVTVTLPGKNPYFEPKTTCDGPIFGISLLLRCLPAWFRFAQCLRRYEDRALKEPWPHIYNAAKYYSLFFVVIFSTWAELNPNPLTITLMVISYVVNATYMFLWDVIVDWGLLDFKAKDNPGLRDELVYRYRAYYYGAILEDLVIRFSWIGIIVCQYAHLAELEIVRTVVYFAELSRRIIWNFFRLENEHLNNCGHYRAVRDIFVMPMPRNTVGTVKKDTTHNGAAAPLQNGFAKSQLGTHCKVVGHKPVPEHYRDPKRVNAPLPSIHTTFAHYGQYMTMTLADSQKPCRSLEDVCSNTCKEHWRKHDFVVSPRMQSAPCVMGAHCQMYNSAPNIPGSNPQTETSSLTDQTNHLRGGDIKEQAAGGSQNAYLSDWDYEPHLGDDSCRTRSFATQSPPIPPAGDTANLIVTGHPCRHTVAAIVNQSLPLSPIASARRRYTGHFDQQEIPLNGRTRRASAQATISLQPAGTVAGGRTVSGGTGAASAATDAVTSTGGNSSTQFDIVILSTSSDCSVDNARTSGRGRNLFLNYTLLPLPEAAVTGGSSDTSAIFSRTRLTAKRLRSVLRSFRGNSSPSIRLDPQGASSAAV